MKKPSIPVILYSSFLIATFGMIAYINFDTYGNEIPVSEATPTPTPTPTATPKPLPKQTPKPLYFSNCSDAHARGYSNIRIGNPGYRSELDRDNDGVACERR